MNKINLMINGLPGNVAMTIVNHVINDKRFTLMPYSLTGPDIIDKTCKIDDFEISLIKPDKRDGMIKTIKTQYNNIYTIDFTHPSSVNSNALFYIDNKLPFVMGTTGGDREKLKDDINKGTIPAVIAPNMTKQIVGFQAMMEYGANTFPDLFKGFTLEINESHQKGKADTSGTAKAMVKYFNKMGLKFTDKDIKKERDPEIQRTIWKIPEEHLAGHGFHTYKIRSEDGTCEFKFEHNLCGRDIYVSGSLDAILFLHTNFSKRKSKDVNFFTMIDVLKIDVLK
ncbi:MAG: dihydrodipicolinate reductase [Desulfobacteraceae bacterium]|nr:dihydrodipicolinate reductase [Desulfobacteraceae bacterium]